MSAAISLNGRRATVSSGAWSVEGGDAAARAWAALLNDMTPPQGVSPTVGYGERWLAARAVKWLAARGVRATVTGFTLETYRAEVVY